MVWHYVMTFPLTCLLFHFAALTPFCKKAEVIQNKICGSTMIKQKIMYFKEAAAAAHFLRQT